MNLPYHVELMPFLSNIISDYQTDLAKANFRIGLYVALDVTGTNFF